MEFKMNCLRSRPLWIQAGFHSYTGITVTAADGHIIIQAIGIHSSYDHAVVGAS
jgi:hypothetical protein